MSAIQKDVKEELDEKIKHEITKALQEKTKEIAAHFESKPFPPFVQRKSLKQRTAKYEEMAKIAVRWPYIMQICEAIPHDLEDWKS